MKKFLYSLKVVFVSQEFFLILFSLFLFFFFRDSVDVFLRTASVNNEEVLKYLLFVPISFFVWIVKEAKDMVVSEKEHLKILVNWPDYWRFKIHVNVSLFYAFVFLFISALPWFGFISARSAISLFLFVTGLIGEFVVSACIYFSQIALKEAFSRDWRVV